MHRRQTIIGALSAAAAAVTGLAASRVTPAKAVFIDAEMEARCAEIRAINTFEDFWASPTAMTAFTHRGDSCHALAVDQWFRLHHNGEGYSFSSGSGG